MSGCQTNVVDFWSFRDTFAVYVADGDTSTKHVAIYLFSQHVNRTTIPIASSVSWGVISGMLNLSRNLGLITGASAMGAVFALASATIDITTARPEAVATGMRITFAVAAMLIVVALAIAVGNRALAARNLLPGDVS